MMLAKRWLPRPLLTLLLWAVWLLLNNTFAPGHLVLGLILAILIPRLTSHFWNPQPNVRRPLLFVRFVLILFYDILVANLHVARRILGSERDLRPTFFEVPLEITGDFPITMLASTITLTPGTVSAQLSEDRKWLLVHSLDVEDVAATIAEIKQRYEAPLKEMFGC